LAWLGLQGYLASKEAGTHQSTALGNQMCKDRLSDKLIKAPRSSWAIYISHDIKNVNF